MRGTGSARRGWIWPATLCVLLFVDSEAAHGQYAARDLTPPGFTAARATGIAAGQQVGYGAGPTTGGRDHALLWQGGADTYRDLHPSGFAVSRAAATSGTQQVGYALPIGSDNPHAVLWTGSRESAVDLHVPGYYWTNGTGVWGDKQTGHGYVHGNAGGGGLVWSGASTRSVGLYSGGFQQTFSLGLCGDQAVGWGIINDFDVRALLWSLAARTVVDLTPSGCTTARALATSGVHQVGYAGGPAMSQQYHALMWFGSPSGYVDLHPPGLHSSFATAASMDLQVGYGSGPDTGGNAHALLWRGSAASVMDLHAFLPDDFSESHATGVDSDGSVVGWAVDGAGAERAILWAAAPPLRIALAARSVTGHIGQEVTLSAAATLVEGGGPVSGLRVRFRIGADTVGIAVTDADGRAAVPYAVPEGAGPGARELTAEHDLSVGYAAARDTAALSVLRGIPAFSLYPVSGTAGGVAVLRSVFTCGGRSIPGRTVRFAVDGAPAGQGTSTASGVAIAYTIPSGLAPGLHNVTVSFDGDTAYLAAARTTAALTVLANVSFSLSAATGAPGSTVVLSTLVYSQGSPVSGLPVQFAVDGKAVGAAVSGASGAALPYAIPATLAPGVHQVTVSFPGNSKYRSATRTTPALTVLPPRAGVSFSLYPVAGSPGGSVILRSLVYSVGAPVSGLTVAFAVDGIPVGSAQSTSAGVALAYTIPAATAPGDHSVAATFAGNIAYLPASRSQLALRVGAPRANVGFSIYPVVGVPGQTIELKSLMVSAGLPVIARTVEFAVDGVPVGQATSSQSGVAMAYTIPFGMQPGLHNVAVAFPGDMQYNPASRTTAALTVK